MNDPNSTDGLNRMELDWAEALGKQKQEAIFGHKCVETTRATIGFPIATTSLLEYKRQLHEVLQLGWRFDFKAGIREEIIQDKVWLCFGLVRDGITREMPSDLALEFIDINWPESALTVARLEAEKKRQKDMGLPQLKPFDDSQGKGFNIESFLLKEMFPKLKSYDS
jgi:hypothetical protein